MKTFLSLVLLLFLIASNIQSQTFAQTPVKPTPVDYKLPYPGILPDHPLYKVKLVRDRLLYIFSRNTVKKTELTLLFADKKIGMAKTLLDKNKMNLAAETVYESQLDLLESALLLQNLAKANLMPVGLPDKIELSIKKHKELISGFESLAFDQYQKEKINQAVKLNNQAMSVVSTVK